MKIGLFDSGIGGLTVLKELLKYHPDHHYIYFGDTLNMPYGNRSKEDLLRLSNNIIKFLISKKVDLIIIACGTVSSNISYDLKNNYSVPIFDIINPTIDYINKNNYSDLGLIATSMTIKSKVFSKQITKVREQECPSFVPLIENNQIDTDICEQKINEYLKPLKDEGIKTLILGCTHYPLLEDKIKNFFDNNVGLINMGTILANSLKLSKVTEKRIELYFSKITNQLVSNVKHIIGNDKINLKIVGDEDAKITGS